MKQSLWNKAKVINAEHAVEMHFTVRDTRKNIYRTAGKICENIVKEDQSSHEHRI